MVKSLVVTAVALLLMAGQALAQEAATGANGAPPTPTTAGGQVTQTKAAEQQAPSLKIVDAVIATGVENRAPVGAADTFSPTVGKLYCFTKVVGAKQPTEIKHVWFFDNKEVTSVTLPVKAISWRTFSAKTIPQDAKGEWRVEIQSTDGNILKTLSFKVQ